MMIPVGTGMWHRAAKRSLLQTERQDAVLPCVESSLTDTPIRRSDIIQRCDLHCKRHSSWCLGLAWFNVSR